MQNMLDGYRENIIHPIEEARNELIRKIYSKNIFCILYRKKYKELLKKYDELWFHSLEFYGKMLED